MEQYLQQLLIVCPLVALAGFVDAVAGGGGIISLPAYLLAGLPIHMAYGTNKLAMCLGTTISAAKFFKNGNINLRPALICAAAALVGSNLGARLALFLSEDYLRYSLMILLPAAAVFLMFKRDFGSNEVNAPIACRKLYSRGIAIGLALGAYDGFFGPGTGTFLVLAFSGVLGYTLLNASGSAKIVNLGSNIGALMAYLMGGKVVFAIAIPAAICAIIGNYFGASLAIKNGSKFIRPMIVCVIILLFAKIITEII